MKKKIKEVVVVEGKTDTATLQNIFEVDTIETKGLSLNDRTLSLIKETARRRGIIVLTDPDFPGNKIRNTIIEAVPNSKHAFIEKKDAIGKKKLGVAEARKEAIIEALNKVVNFDNQQTSITWNEFVQLGVIGSKEKRNLIYKEFNLGYGNNKALFKRLNMLGITKEEIEKKGIL